jgi:hypothetical protein
MIEGMEQNPYEAPIESRSPAHCMPRKATDFTKLLLALALGLILSELCLFILPDKNLPGEVAIWLSWVAFWRVIPMALVVTLAAAAISHFADMRARNGNQTRTLRPVRYDLRTLMIVLALGPPAIASVWLWPSVVILIMVVIVMMLCVLVACDCEPRV